MNGTSFTKSQKKIARQLADGAIKVDDLEVFNEDVRERILSLSGIDTKHN